MKLYVMVFTLFLIPFLCDAKEFKDQSHCDEELTNFIVPSLTTVINKKEIHAELTERNAGVYSVRLFAAANSPDNLDKQVSVGWVNLDTNTNTVFDITKDITQPQKLIVNSSKYIIYKNKCLGLGKNYFVTSRRSYIYTKDGFKSKQFLIKGDQVEATMPISGKWAYFNYKHGKATGWLNVQDLSSTPIEKL